MTTPASNMIDPVRLAWESLNRAPWPDEAITRWTGAMITTAPEVVEARKQRKNAATRLVRRTSEADRERRRAYAAAVYAKKKAARLASAAAPQH
jgi:hypothetical protein